MTKRPTAIEAAALYVALTLAMTWPLVTDLGGSLPGDLGDSLLNGYILSWGEKRLDSGLASILQGAVPIFNALLAFLFFQELRVRGLKLVGLAIGFVGVALLVGAQPHGKLLAAVAVVAMALCYAFGTLVTEDADGHRAGGEPPDDVPGGVHADLPAAAGGEVEAERIGAEGDGEERVVLVRDAADLDEHRETVPRRSPLPTPFTRR